LTELKTLRLEIYSRCVCPTCQNLCDSCTETLGREQQPQTGDMGICLKCGAFNEYRETESGYYELVSWEGPVGPRDMYVQAVVMRVIQERRAQEEGVETLNTSRWGRT
jgi:hypothetical protein